MEEYFEITNGEYIFDCIIELDEEYIEIYFGNSKMRSKSCVHITIKNNNETATLEGLKYETKCDLNGKLENGIGTIKMLKTALRFVFDKYKFLKAIDYHDKAQKDRINITPKSLLLGLQPWYVKHFEARPNNSSTERIINKIKKINLSEEDKNIISKKSWGTDEEIDYLCYKYGLKCIIGTSWKIDKANIMNYDVSYEIRKVQKGGGKLKKIIRKAERSYYSTMHL